MEYVEEKTFTIRVEIRCAFPEDYQGELDGYEWFKDFQSIADEMVHAVLLPLQRRPGWRVRTGNRGRPSDEEVTLVVERTMDK